jgi:multiple sugar transport system permease protein
LLGWVLLAPALVLVFGLVVYPLAYDLALSLTDAHAFAGPGHFVGLTNFAHVLSDAAFLTAARNSAVYALITATARLGLGLAMGLLLWRLRWGRAAVFIALFIPWVFPAALSGFAFYWLLSPPFHTFYTLPLLQLRFALTGLLGSDLWLVGAIALHDIWRSSAFLAIFVLAGLNSLPTDPLDYSRLDCQTGWQRFRYVLLPMLRRMLVLAMLLSLVISFIDYTSIYLQTGGRITWPLIGTLAYQASFQNGETALGATHTLAQLPFWAVVLWLGFRLFERESRPVPPRETESRPIGLAGPEAWRFQPAFHPATPLPVRRVERVLTWRRYAGSAGLTLGAVAVVVFAVFPIWWIFLQAIRPVEEDALGNPFWTWAPTLDGFTAALHGRLVGIWLLNTAVVLVVGIAIMLVASVLAGYALSRTAVPGRRWIARLLFCCYFLPQPMVLVPIYQMFLALNLDNTLLSVILLNQTLTIPFATWLCFTYFEGLPRDVEDYAALDGSRWAIFRHIVLPMSWPVLIAAGIFAAGVMASDFVYAGLLLVHNNVQTIAVGLGVIGISLDEFDTITGGIGMAAAPLVIVCALFAPAYVRGLSAAMVEGA